MYMDNPPVLNGLPTEGERISGETPVLPAKSNWPIWTAIIAVTTVVACLCGLVGGGLFLLAGISVYSSMADVAVTQVTVVSGPTYTRTRLTPLNRLIPCSQPTPLPHPPLPLHKARLLPL